MLGVCTTSQGNNPSCEWQNQLSLEFLVLEAFSDHVVSRCYEARPECLGLCWSLNAMKWGPSAWKSVCFILGSANNMSVCIGWFDWSTFVQVSGNMAYVTPLTQLERHVFWDDSAWRVVIMMTFHCSILVAFLPLSCWYPSFVSWRVLYVHLGVSVIYI